MSNIHEEAIRSTDLMSRDDTALLVVDLQEKLLAAIPDRTHIVWNASRLIRGAKLLGLPVLATEQYPQGLGPTVEPLRTEIPTIAAKMSFSCIGCEEVFRLLDDGPVHRVLLCGVETHVCILQTALDLLANGWRVYVAVDAVGSRFRFDHEIALRRLETCGAILTTTEAALFEWCQTAAAPEFKQISALVRETPTDSDFRPIQ